MRKTFFALVMAIAMPLIAETQIPEGISQQSYDWILNNTYHHTNFSDDLSKLLELKIQRGVTISVVLPALNEEPTVGAIVREIRQRLMIEYPIVDELILVDGDSQDKTREIAQREGAVVYQASDILPCVGSLRGKGEQLWKSLYIAKGDIIVHVDTDILNFHHRFISGLIGPLLARPDILYVKAFYDRPISSSTGEAVSLDGGRVTEIGVRPWLSRFWPELSWIRQPLSGEYAARREVLEEIPYPVGYGVETSHLIDISERWGIDSIAQVDMERRVHRNSPTASLGKMSMGITETILNRLHRQQKVQVQTTSNKYWASFASSKEGSIPRPVPVKVEETEREPMVSIEEYRLRTGK